MTVVKNIRGAVLGNKSFKHTDVSDKYKCDVCGKPIKLRLLHIKKTPPKLCYHHWKREGVKNASK